MANGIEEFDEDRQRAKIRSAFSGGSTTEYNPPPTLTFVKKNTAQEIKNNTGSVKPSGSMGPTYNERKNKN